MTKLVAVITAPHFCAGFVMDDDTVRRTAPIIRYMEGWSRKKVREYCADKGWGVCLVSPSKHLARDHQLTGSIN